MSFVKTNSIVELEKILVSGKFFPVLITGPTGCGKTYPIINLAAENGRKISPVNITHLTDETTLIGGIRIKDGTTYFEEGPVIKAMREGSILLLDELDLALPENIMCLQTILDGSGYFIKQTGEYVMPARGFTVFATGNTKGLGDETGVYIGTNILNEAFLERFILTFDFDYMSSDDEFKVLKGYADEEGINAKDSWLELLVEWANQIRDTIKKSNDFTHNISTRRLVQILKTYSIYGDEGASVMKCLNRFDEHHRESFYNMYELKDGNRSTEKSNALVENVTKQYIKAFTRLDF